MEKIIEKIHHDINTAYLDKFQKCSEIIDREQVSSDKYDIAKLGFKSYESEIEKFENIKKSKEYIEVVNRLKIEYPYKKFITYDQIGKILEKYPLVLNTPERFIGAIPTNCIKDILNFKLQKHDEGYSPVPNIYSLLKKDNTEFTTITNIVRSLLDIFKERGFIGLHIHSHMRNDYEIKERKEKLSKLKENNGENLIDSIIAIMGLNNNSSYSKSSFKIRNYYYKVNADHGYIDLNCYSLLNSDYNITVTPYLQAPSVPEHGPKFWILATADQFDIKPSEIVVGGCIKEVGQGDSLVLLKDDPIILKPIKEGLIVVKQWGDEAQLPEFINSNDN